MSYEIIYNRLFVKLEKDNIPVFIPMLFWGSNNCTQTSRRGREIRERSWSNIKSVTNHKTFATEKDILKSIDDYRLEKIKSGEESAKQWNDSSFIYDDKRFGWHASIALYGKGTSGTSFASWKNLFKIGMEKAMTVEELLNENVNVTLHVSTYSADEIKKAGLEVKEDVTFTSTEQAVEVIEKYEAYYKGVAPDCLYVNFGSEWSVERLIANNRRKNKRGHKEKKRVEVESCFVLGNSKGFFVKYTKRGYKYSYDTDSYMVKKFLTAKEAEKKLKKMRSASEGWQVIKVNEKTTVYM